LYGGVSLLPSGAAADIAPVRPFVTVVICAVVAVPAAASASPRAASPLREASRLSGLRVRHTVPTAALSAARYGTLYARASSRAYPASLRRADETAYARFGLLARSVMPQPSRAWYDVGTRHLFVQRTPAAGRRALIEQYVRALIDQNFNLKRLSGLRVRDRDRWTAANAIVDGTAALASGMRAAQPHGTPLDRFSSLERDAGRGPGRTLAAQLRYLGGRDAAASALRTFPRTTEQLLHVDKFLEREPALAVSLPEHTGGADLAASETFGELDVRNFLQAFGVSGADTAAAGWGGGRLALYGDTGVIVIRWDTATDAAEWQATVPRYVAAAFPGVAAHICPPLDQCWGDVAAGVFGTTSVLAAGPDAARVAAALLAAA
jgi:hypothetical protein